MKIVETENLTRIFGSGEAQVVALDGVSLHVDTGEFVAVMGPSGCGKSTLLHMIGGLDRPTEGVVKIDGQDLSTLNDDDLTDLRREHIGFIFQFFNLIPTLTALDNTALPLVLGGTKPGDAQTQAAEWLEKLEVADRSTHRPDELSGGQRQRVAIARSLVTDPSLILADEPTGNLDSKATKEFAVLLRDTVDRWGRSILLVTHDPRISSFADRIIYLKDGRISDQAENNRECSRRRLRRRLVMRELPLAISYLKGRPIRSIMTILSITIGVMMMFGMNGMAPAFKDMFISSTQSMALTEVDLYVTRRDGSFFRQEYEQNVGAVPGVESTAGMIARPVAVPPEQYFTADGSEISTIQVFGVDTAVTDEAFNFVTAGGRRLTAGRLLQAGDVQAVLISEQFAEGLGIGVGEAVRLPGAGGWLNFEVVGLLNDPGIMLGTQQVFMSIPAAQDLLNTPNRINTIMGRYAEGSDARAIDAAVQSIFGRGYELSPLEGGADIWAALLEYINVIFTMFGLMSLAMAGLIMFNTFRTSVAERKRDIGMLRSIGARRKIVMRTVLYEGLILAVLGTGLGMLLGYGFAYGAKAGLDSVLENFLGRPMGQPRFTFFAYAVSIIFGLGVPLVSVLLPARNASQVTPLEAMRPSTIAQEAAIKRSRLIIGLVSLVLGVAGLLSGIIPTDGAGDDDLPAGA